MIRVLDPNVRWVHCLDVYIGELDFIQSFISFLYQKFSSSVSS